MTDEYSDQVLEQTPERATALLTGLGADASIRTLMDEAKMADEDIVEGRTLLLACLAAPLDVASRDTDEAAQQRTAVAALDAWDEPNFARYRATLTRRFPEAGAYVFQSLSAAQGVAAVTGVATFLARINTLEQGSDQARKAQHKTDKKAVEHLGSRGLDKPERLRLAALVSVALGPTSVLDKVPAATRETRSRAARRAALVALRGWYDEWAATARAVLKKRSHLIRLGLAQRKSRSPKTPKPPG